MPGDRSTVHSDSTVKAELLFLIARFLSNGPCKKAAEVLLQELQTHELFPKGFDWEGNERNRSYDQLVHMHRHLGPDYLLKLVQRVGPLLDKLVPTETHGIQSLLGAGSMSLLRTPESVKNTQWSLKHQMVLQNGCPRVGPRNLLQLSTVQSLHARTARAAGVTHGRVPTSFYSRVALQDRKLGHLAAIYCVTFDRTGQYIFTGADDKLIKIWAASTGRLLATLRGHGAEITDLTVSYENTLLASGSTDKSVRVWCLQSKAPVAVLHGHTGSITTIEFSPQCKGDGRVLMSAGSDGCVCFWMWDVKNNTFNPKPKKFVERSHAGAQMLCSSFSPGGMFVATGNSDHVIRVYFLYASEPTKICELEAHMNVVDSVCYSHSSNRFVTGSEDGIARIWHYEQQEWKSKLLDMGTVLNSAGVEVALEESKRPTDGLRVSMVCWSMDDSLVITAVNDYSIKVWAADTGKLLHQLKAHEDEVYVLDAHPLDYRVLLSCGHDGNIILWDIEAGKKLSSFYNSIPGQGYGAVYDCKFTPDGLNIAATDSHGHLIFLGFGANGKIKTVPQEVFFHTDYRPLVFDAKGYALDELTQQPPHLLPPPYLVSSDGYPFPPALQRLVPGRENCPDSQLMPPITLSDIGTYIVNDYGVYGDQDYPVNRGVDGEEGGDAPPAVNGGGNNNDRQQAAAGDGAAVDARGPQPRGGQGLDPRQRDHDYIRRIARARLQAANNAAAINPGGRGGDSSDDDEGGDGEGEDGRRRSIDEMIRNLQRQQDQQIQEEGGDPPLASPPPPEDLPPPPPPPPPPALRAGRANRAGSLEDNADRRRASEIERMRRLLANARRQARIDCAAAFSKHIVVRPIDQAVLQTSEEKRVAMAEEETKRYLLERKKKPSVPNTPSTLFGNMSRGKQAAAKKRSPQDQTVRNRLTTRALYDTEEEEEETEHSDRNSEDSSYSDWTMEGSSNLQPPKRRSKRKPKRRAVSTSEEEDEDEEIAVVDTDDDDDDDDDDAGNDDKDEEYKAYLKRPKKTTEKAEEAKEEGKKKAPVTPKAKKATKPSKKKSEGGRKPLPEITELKEEFRPPEWLTGTIPRKTPYVPQMGDEVMYFRQGHELYLQAVERHKSYELGSNTCLPWHKNPHLREMELVKIIGIRYEVKPPRLCSLKLAYLNADTGKTSGGSFSIRYHDMPDVIDFLVLKQHFDTAYQRHWKPGARFRSMIDDQWWMGKIQKQGPLDARFPDSMFQCFFVHWDNGEYEHLSPWDMEPINENLMPSSVGEGVPVDPEELRGMLYTPKPHEWLSSTRELETERIVRGMEAVMEHSAAEPFSAPVDLNAFPVYAVIIEYPVDLSTIKARLENGYYRRINALQWDIRHIESNAKKFNEDNTPISRSAGIVTDTLLKFISDTSCVDPMPILEQRSQGQQFNWGRKEEDGEGTSSGPTSKRKQRQAKEPKLDPDEWKRLCQELLGVIMESDDAAPFLEGVDPELYPNYYAVIESPMDLSVVQSQLTGGQYASPMDFAKDVRLIFQNSRTFNTNKRSRIFSMTLRLSAMFEERVQRILTGWRAVSKSKSTGASSSRASSSAAETSSREHVGSSSQGGVSTSQTSLTSRLKPGSSSVSRSLAAGRLMEERPTRSAASSRRVAAVPSSPSSSSSSSSSADSDGTEIGEAEEDKKLPVASQGHAVKGENYNEDEDTEVEDDDDDDDDDARFNVARGKKRLPANKGARKNTGKQVSNGHTSYRTRAKTGSLRPRRYLSSDDDEDHDVRRHDSKRAQSLSSHESSLIHDDEADDNESTEGSSSSESDSDSHSDFSNSHHSHRAGQKRSKVKGGHGRGKKPARKAGGKGSGRKRPRLEVSSEDGGGHSEDNSDESDSSTESEEEVPVRKSKVARPSASASGAHAHADRGASGRKLSGSAKRTTRNQGKRTFNYLEDSCDEYEDDPSRLSVSSRGRIRKMTKRARANRVDD